jgi:hypothetical protein
MKYMKKLYKRPCKLVNYKTGQIINAESIVDFCKEAGLNGNDVYHLTPILDGKRLHHKKWCLPEILNKKIELKDVYGNFYSGTIKDLMNKYKVPFIRLFKLLNGSKENCNGLMLKDKKIKYIPLKPYAIKNYQIKTPNNKILSGRTLRLLANRTNGGISYGRIAHLVHGKADIAKGYKFHGYEVTRLTSI